MNETDIEHLREKFGVALMVFIPMYVRADTINPEYITGDFPPQNLIGSIFQKLVGDLVLPVMKAAEFYEKTALENFGLGIAIVEEHKTLETFQYVSKKKKSHSITKTFHWSSVPQTDEGFVRFAAQAVFDTFEILDKRYKLNPSLRSVLESMHPEFIASPVATVHQEVDEDAYEELEINFKLSDSSFGTADEILHNHNFEEEIIEVIEVAGLGTWDGHETGLGIATVFFKCDNASKALKEVRKHFKSRFSAGSFARIDKGKKLNLG